MQLTSCQRDHPQGASEERETVLTQHGVLFSP